MRIIKALKSAYADYRVCKCLRSNLENDGLFINRIAYLISQCFEKVIEAFLEYSGVWLSRTHSIEGLLKTVKRTEDCKLVITTWVEDHADTITLWEVEIKHNLDFCAELEKVDEALTALGEFLRVNGISDILRDELSADGTLKKLQDFLPPGEYDNFSLNVYYQLFKDELNDNDTIKKLI